MKLAIPTASGRSGAPFVLLLAALLVVGATITHATGGTCQCGCEMQGCVCGGERPNCGSTKCGAPNCGATTCPTRCKNQSGTACGGTETRVCACPGNGCPHGGTCQNEIVCKNNIPPYPHIPCGGEADCDCTGPGCIKADGTRNCAKHCPATPNPSAKHPCGGASALLDCICGGTGCISPGTTRNCDKHCPNATETTRTEPCGGATSCKCSAAPHNRIFCPGVPAGCTDQCPRAPKTPCGL